MGMCQIIGSLMGLDKIDLLKVIVSDFNLNEAKIFQHLRNYMDRRLIMIKPNLSKVNPIYASHWSIQNFTMMLRFIWLGEFCFPKSNKANFIK